MKQPVNSAIVWQGGNIHSFYHLSYGVKVLLLIYSISIDTVEAKINPNAFNSSNLKAFRDNHPEGNDYLVCPYVKDPYQIRAAGRPITVC